MTDMKVILDLQPWKDEFDQEEPEIKNQEDAIALMLKTQWSSDKMARLLWVSRELGLADPDVLPSNEELFHKGTRQTWREQIAAATRKATMPNGKEREVRAYTLSPAGPAEALAESDTDLSCTRAMMYLAQKVSGHIMGRFEILAAHQPEQLEKAVRLLHSSIDDLYLQLVNGSQEL